MFNICLYGVDLRRRENIPSFSFKLIFLGTKEVVENLYDNILPRIKCERFNDVSTVKAVVIGEKRFWYFEFIGSEKTIRSFLQKLTGYRLVTGLQLLINSCDLEADLAFNKRSEMMEVNRVLVGSRFEEIKDIVKQFSINENVGKFLRNENVYDKHRLINTI